MIFGRHVIMTTLDPVPLGLRTVPGLLAMNKAELEAFNAGDRETCRMITGICLAAASAEALLGGAPLPKMPRRRLSAPVRMFMLRAVYLQRDALESQTWRRSRRQEGPSR